MGKNVKRIIGSVLALWAAIRLVPDTLESISATAKYGRWAYDHLAVYLSVPPRGWGISAVIFVIGIGLIFSETIQYHLAKRWPWPRGKTNIVLNHMALTKLGWDTAAGCYRRPQHLPDGQRDNALFANLLHISNESTPNERIVAAGSVKAQINYTIGDTRYQASPGTWVDTPLNTVDLGVGDTHYLILQLGTHITQGWFPVVNRRASLQAPVATNGAFDLWPDSEGDIDLQLLDEHGRVLAAYAMRWRWDYNMTPQTFGLRKL